MKNTAKFLLAASLLTAAGAASAGEFVTVEIKGRVQGLYDPDNVLGGQVTEGQLVTGEYKYDIHTPDQAVSPYSGGYHMPDATMKLVVGSLVFQSAAEAPFGMVSRAASVAAIGGESPPEFRVMSYTNQPLPNGATVERFEFEFRDSTGQQPATDALPSAAPNLHSFDYHSAFVYGELNGHSYSMRVEIESTYSDGMTSDLVISPGKSTFVSGQRFDVALVLPAGSQIAHATASLDGQPLPMSFPGSCNLAPPNLQNRPTIICPDAHLQLPEAAGQYRIHWEVELIDGTSIGHPVEWTFIE
ncbi:hypothetical protein [Steroidobacter agaridevorans]|uniref:hypothetical protein n=1 Tax=Steroidobacter agaridevorans TaxID=2695856 RepID=UPI001326E43F|nr:hypothetical protein [Steroidobacter agaridevorans]GFE90277.1 hypothetical protein GCM10011488_52310 [Steroidobacter agaridevorans]